MNWKEKCASLSCELADARETNRLLHRRMQAAEGPLLGKIHWLEWETEYRRKWAVRLEKRCDILEAEVERKHGFLFIKKLRAKLKGA